MTTYAYGESPSHLKAREVEGHIRNIRESRAEWEAKLAELDRELEQEQNISRQLRAKQTIAEKRLADRTERLEAQTILCQQIRAKYQDPPGEGRRRMAVILNEIDEYQLRKRNAS